MHGQKNIKLQHNLFATVIHIFFERRNPATTQSSLSESSYQLTLPVVYNQPHFIAFYLFSLHKECGIGTWRL